MRYKQSLLFPIFLLLLLCLLVPAAGCFPVRNNASAVDLRTASAAGFALLREGTDEFAAFSIVENAGFVRDKSSRYFTISSRDAAEEYKESLTVRNIERIIASGEQGCAVCLEPGWIYFTSPLALDEKALFPSPKGAAPENWTLAFLIAGSGHFHQRQTLLFPQRTLSRAELDTVTNFLRKNYSGTIRTRPITETLQAVDIIFKNPHSNDGWPARLSYYSGEVAPGKYQLVIEYTVDTLPQ